MMHSNRPLALVTGASSGIGMEMARGLAAQGYDLVLVARTTDPMMELAAHLHKQFSIDADIVGLDLATPGAAQALLHKLGARSQQIEVLVNNAGFGLRTRFEDMTLQDVTRMMQLNMGTLAELCALLTPQMVRKGRGRIINISSVAAFQACPYMALYGATKAFVLSLSEALNVELKGTGVTVTAVCPGATDTQFHRVAGTTNALALRLMDSAAKVACLALKAALAGRALVITGTLNKSIPWASRALPRHMVGRAAGLLFKK